MSGRAAADSPLALARIGRPHGIRGEVTCVVLTPPEIDFAALAEGRTFLLRRAGRIEGPARVERLRPSRDHFILQIEGASTPEAAEALRGAELCLRRSELPPLPEDWHWEADLEGLRVEDPALGFIGTVSGLEEIAGRWSLRVDRPAGGPPVMIPWVKALLPVVDLEGGRIVSELPSNFLDPN